MILEQAILILEKERDILNADDNSIFEYTEEMIEAIDTVLEHRKKHEQHCERLWVN